MSDSPSDDEFNQFLTQSTKDEERSREGGARMARVMATIELALTNYGIPIPWAEPDEEIEQARYELFLQEALDQTDSSGWPLTREDAEHAARWSLAEYQATERFVITTIGMRMTADAVMERTPEEAALKKQEFFAELIASGKLPPDSPLFRVADELLEGGPIDIDEPDMARLLMEASARSTQAHKDDDRTEGHIRDALVDSGARLDDPDVDARFLLMAAHSIYLAHAMKIRPADAEEAAFKAARESDLEPDLSQKLARYFITHPHKIT